MFQHSRRWGLIGASLLSLVVAAAICVALSSGAPEKAKAAPESRKRSDASSAEGGSREGGSRLRVEIAHPKAGGVDRTSVQPGSVIAFESAQLYAKISGYLKSQPVDIGSQVKRGQVLAEIDAPELFKDVDRAKAAVDQALAEVKQADARVLTAMAGQEAAEAAVTQAKAEVDRTAATRSFREKQHERIKELYASHAIDARLVDEKLQEMDAALASESAARAAVVTSRANVSSAAAKVEEAKSDVVNAKAHVEVAQAALAKAQVYVDYTQITSPYDGVVTKRNFFRGDFIRAADQGGVLPLLAVDQTGVMRMVVQVPDRDVPFTNTGDAAEIEIDALPGQKFSAKVSRVADAEDPDTRTMRTEIDLANDQRLLRQGMYGRVTIHLAHSQKTVSIPASCITGNVKGDQGQVFVIQAGVAHLRTIRISDDNGLRIEVLGGLSPDDEVVQRPSGALTDGAAVEVISHSASAAKE